MKNEYSAVEEIVKGFIFGLVVVVSFKFILAIASLPGPVSLSDKEAAVIDCMRSYGRPAFDARSKFIGCATR